MSDKIDRFPIYRNSYNLTKFLPKAKQEKMALAILEYVFDDKEPQFNDNDSNTLWENIFLILRKTKAQVLNGRKGGKKTNPEANGQANPEANGQANPEANGQANPEANGQANPEPNNIYYFIFIISNFIKENNYSKNIELSLKKWIKYKLEKKNLPTETSFEELLKVVKKYIQKYGEEKVCDLINNCIASNYQAIIFEKINSSKNNRKNSTELPGWYGKEIKSEEMSEEEIKSLEEKIRHAGIKV